MSAFDRLVKHGLPLVPKPIVGYFARPYVAGASLDDAVATIRSLNAEGAMATVDVLGEEVVERAKAESAVEEYTRLLERIAKEGIDANVSIKLTLLGLKLDESLCSANVGAVAARAAALGNFVRIDMEDHTTTDSTLGIVRQLRTEFLLRNVPVHIERRPAIDAVDPVAAGRGGPQTPASHRLPAVGTAGARPHHAVAIRGLARHSQQGACAEDGLSAAAHRALLRRCADRWD